MVERRELDIPLPREDEDRRWTSGVALLFVGASVIAVGLAFCMVPRTSLRPGSATGSSSSVGLLKEPAARDSIMPVRAPHVILPNAPGKSVPAKSSRDFRVAQALPTTFSDVVRRNNGKAFVGRILRFNAVNVVTTPADNVISIGSSPSDSVMVRVDPSSTSARMVASKISPGEKVFVVGRLMPAPTQETMRRWGLSTADEDKIGHHALYIRAMVVQPESSAGAAEY